MNFYKGIVITLLLVSLDRVCGNERKSFFQRFNDRFWHYWQVTKDFFRSPWIVVINTPSTVKPPDIANGRNPQEARDAYLAFFGNRISQTKCQQYKTRYEFDSLMSDAMENRTALAKTIKVNIVPGVFRIQAFGRDARGEEFPHMGALGWRALTNDWRFLCGSSLISPNFILTAAYCTCLSSRHFNLLDSRPQNVRLGAKDISQNSNSSIDVNISRIIVHPDYKYSKRFNDIALMELNERVTFNMQVQPACVWVDPEVYYPDSKIYGTGWEYKDLLEADNTNKSSLLQAVDVKIIDKNKCNEDLRAKWKLFNGVNPHQICAGVTEGRLDPCQGDAGGPIQVKITSPISMRDAGMSYVIGVLSRGFGCTRPDLPLLYTNVSSYLDWIEDNVWHEELNSEFKIEEEGEK